MVTNLHFTLFVQKKLQTSPLSLVSYVSFCSCTIRNGLLVIVFPWFSEYNISIWTSLHQKTNHNLRPQVDFTQLTEQVYANQFIFIKKDQNDKKQTNKPQGSPTYEKTGIYVPACVPCFGQFAPERFSFQPGSERIGVVRQKPYRQQTTMYTFTTLIQNKSIKIGKAVTRMAFFLLTVLLQLESTWTRTFPNSSR